MPSFSYCFCKFLFSCLFLFALVFTFWLVCCVLIPGRLAIHLPSLSMNCDCLVYSVSQAVFTEFVSFSRMKMISTDTTSMGVLMMSMGRKETVRCEDNTHIYYMYIRT